LDLLGRTQSKKSRAPVFTDWSARATPVCVVFLKLFEKVYALLTAGLLAPFRGDRLLAEEKRCELDRLYQRICDDLEALLHTIGLKVWGPYNRK
jgi:hypothetical protein